MDVYRNQGPTLARSFHDAENSKILFPVDPSGQRKGMPTIGPGKQTEARKFPKARRSESHCD